MLILLKNSFEELKKKINFELEIDFWNRIFSIHALNVREEKLGGFFFVPQRSFILVLTF